LTLKRWENGSGGRTHKELEVSCQHSDDEKQEYNHALWGGIITEWLSATATAIHDRVYDRNEAWMLDMVRWSLAQPPPAQQRLP
jgi:hypothetical protein